MQKEHRETQIMLCSREVLEVRRLERVHILPEERKSQISLGGQNITQLSLPQQ